MRVSLPCASVSLSVPCVSPHQIHHNIRRQSRFIRSLRWRPSSHTVGIFKLYTLSSPMESVSTAAPGTGGGDENRSRQDNRAPMPSIPGQGSEPQNGGSAVSSTSAAAAAPAPPVRLWDKAFSDLNLNQGLLAGLSEIGWTYLRPVQKECWSLGKRGISFLGLAKSGAGKTGAYLLPLLQKVDPGVKSLQGVVIVPSQESALQMVGNLTTLCAFKGIRVALATGGSGSVNTPVEVLLGAQILAATPSRFLDLERDGLVNTKKVSVLILDSADKLKNKELNEVINRLPALRQTMVLASSFPVSCELFLKNQSIEMLVDLRDQPNFDGVTHYCETIRKEELRYNFNTYQKIFDHLPNRRQCLIFTSSTRDAEHIGKLLASGGEDCSYVTGRMDLLERTQLWEHFKNGYSRTLVTSDLFRRGIPIEAVNVVINVKVPSDSEVYRLRTGRIAGHHRPSAVVNLILSTENHLLNGLKTSLTIEILPFRGQEKKGGGRSRAGAAATQPARP